MRKILIGAAIAGLLAAGCASRGDNVEYPDEDRVVEDLEAQILSNLGKDADLSVTQMKVVGEWSKDDYAGYRIIFEISADADINKTLPTGEVFILKDGQEVQGCEATAVYDREQNYDPWKLRGILLTKPLCKPLRD